MADAYSVALPLSGDGTEVIKWMRWLFSLMEGDKTPNVVQIHIHV